MQVVYLEKGKKKARGSGVGVCLYVGWWFFSRGPHFLCLNIHAWMRSPLRDFHNYSGWVIYLWFRCLCTGSTYTFILNRIHILSSRGGWGNYEVRTFCHFCSPRGLFRIKIYASSEPFIAFFFLHIHAASHVAACEQKEEIAASPVSNRFQKKCDKLGCKTGWGWSSTVYMIKIFDLFHFAKCSMQSKTGWLWLRFLLKNIIWRACYWCVPAAIMTE